MATAPLINPMPPPPHTLLPYKKKKKKKNTIVEARVCVCYDVSMATKTGVLLLEGNCRVTAERAAIFSLLYLLLPVCNRIPAGMVNQIPPDPVSASLCRLQKASDYAVSPAGDQETGSICGYVRIIFWHISVVAQSYSGVCVFFYARHNNTRVTTAKGIDSAACVFCLNKSLL